MLPHAIGKNYLELLMLERKVYNIIFCIIINVCYTSHSGLANVNIRKGMLYSLNVKLDSW